MFHDQIVDDVLSFVFLSVGINERLFYFLPRLLIVSIVYFHYNIYNFSNITILFY